jgi:hypothetical protein
LHCHRAGDGIAGDGRDGANGAACAAFTVVLLAA